MDFCLDCGSLLQPRKIKSSRQETFLLFCPKCGYEKVEKNLTSLGIGKTISHNAKQLVAAISIEEQRLNTLPTANVECPNCGNHKAYARQVQTRGADESSTQFFRCAKCSYTFRDCT